MNDAANCRRVARLYHPILPALASAGRACAGQQRSLWRTFALCPGGSRSAGRLAAAAFTLPQTLDAVERAIDIQLQPQITAFYTTQFAGDMQASFGENQLTLLQVWSEDDFLRLQENLIGHLVMQRRLKQSPTLFIATTESEQEIISLSNLSGK